MLFVHQIGHRVRIDLVRRKVNDLVLVQKNSVEDKQEVEAAIQNEGQEIIEATKLQEIINIVEVFNFFARFSGVFIELLKMEFGGSRIPLSRSRWKLWPGKIVNQK